MSYRFTQLSPQSTHGTSVRFAVRGPWSTRPENLRDMQFWRSWLEIDSEVDETRPHSRINWNAILGLAVMTVVSSGFWAGVGFMISRVWR
jgi:hypothetical protein